MAENNRMLKRSEVPKNLCWNMERFFDSDEAYQESFNSLAQDIKDFCQAYQNKINTLEASELLTALKQYEKITLKLNKCGIYSHCLYDVDLSDSTNKKRSATYSSKSSEYRSALDFFKSEIITLDNNKLKDASELDPKYSTYFLDIIKEKEHRLSPDVERCLISLSTILDFPYDCYEISKLTDISFDDFEADGKIYPNSYVLYENTYAISPSTEVRRAAFKSFSDGLKKFRNSTAAMYNAHIQREKIEAGMRGFSSVFDYLMFEQKGSKELYDRQIDLIMSKFSLVIQRYARLLKKKLGLDKIYFSDLKANLISIKDENISIDELHKLVSDALKPMGSTYHDMVMKYVEEGWCDFAMNEGKCTGGYCGALYGDEAIPYILKSYNGTFSEAYTLIHELGHAANFILSNRNNSIFQVDLPMSIVEAPSTFHELLLTNSLLNKAKTEEERVLALTRMLSNTYYHNFVTHLLEADYQRKVYKAVDRGENLTADDLDAYMKETLHNFYGDDVILDDGAELTWMRQPHYYMGLYSYTYSAGLTLATEMFLKIRSAKSEEERNKLVEQWTGFLAYGDRGDIYEIAEVSGSSFRTSQALENTIVFLDESVSELERSLA